MTVTRMADGSAGDANYATLGEAYTQYRRPDPRIGAHIAAALGDARTVLNVGAGAGSYEPGDRVVTPVEPSTSMRAKRPAGLAVAVDATAERLPFDDGAFDAAMTTFSVHQWGDLRAGLRELRRVTRGPVVLLTGDPDNVRDFWLYEYAPEVLDTEARRYPSVAELADGLGGGVTVASVPIPLDCTDTTTDRRRRSPNLHRRPVLATAPSLPGLGSVTTGGDGPPAVTTGCTAGSDPPGPLPIFPLTTTVSP